MMVERFQIFNHQVNVRDKYQALRQTTSVVKYINDFQAFVVELVEEPMESQIHQFLKGLKPSVQASTRTHKPTSLLQAMDIADEADRAAYHATKGDTQGTKRDGKPSWKSKFGKSGAGNTNQQDGATLTLQLGAATLSSAEKQDCFKKNLFLLCKKPGHRARDCKSRRKAEN